MNKKNLEAVLVPSPKLHLKDYVVERLREVITSGYFEPGEPLSEMQLAESLGVSRGPIREALVQLELEGLVVKEPNKSAIVARLSKSDLYEVYSLRLAYEQLAIREAVNNAEPSDIDQLETIVKQMADCETSPLSQKEAAELDIHFHETLCKISKHHRLYEGWLTLKSQIYIFLVSRNIKILESCQEMIESHQGIVDALRLGDEVSAIQAITEHMQIAYTHILNNTVLEIPDREELPHKKRATIL